MSNRKILRLIITERAKRVKCGESSAFGLPFLDYFNILIGLRSTSCPFGYPFY